MAGKKPSQLSNSLLTNRPRKGQAQAQSEQAATLKRHYGGRRGYKSPNTEQINIKMRPDVAERFTALAEQENIIFGDLLEKLIDKYEETH